MQLPLESQIESILFFKGEAISIKNLSQTLLVTEGEIKDAVEKLKESLSNRGLELIINDNSLLLTTSSEMSEIIEKISKEELMKDLSKAALETLSIVLYRSPIKRSEIDYIRGVNSQTILRSLAIRGLIIKKQDTLDERTYIYNPSTELLQFLGIAQKEDMPEYSKVEEEMKTFLQQERGGDGEVSNNTES